MDINTFTEKMFNNEIPLLKADTTTPFFDHLETLLYIDNGIVICDTINNKSFVVMDRSGIAFYVDFKIDEKPIFNKVLNVIGKYPMFWAADKNNFTGNTQSMFFTIENKPDLLFNPYTDNKIVKKSDIENLINDDELNLLNEKYNNDLIKNSFEEISEDSYNWKLECLPPLNWGIHNGLDSFFMCEFYTGNITEQVVKSGGRYFKKLVDYKDKTTWLTVNDLK